MKIRKTIASRPDQNKKEKRSRLLFSTTVWVFLAAIFYIFFISDFLRVNAILVEGNFEIETGEIQKAVSEKTNGKYWGVLRKDNLLIFPAKSAAGDLAEKFKKIRKIKTRRKFPDKIVFEIEERRTAFALFSAEKAYFVDEKGVAYEEIFRQSAEDFLDGRLVLKNHGGQDISLGSEVSGPDYAAYLFQIKENLAEAFGIETESLMETPNIISREVRAKTLEGWVIYFNTEIPLEKELGMLKVFLEKSFKDKNRSDLEYVDLRSENKIFYKLKNSEEQEEEENKEEVKGEEDKKVEEKKDKKKKK